MLTPGAKIGPYDVVGSLGAGGMGEVYRARDARLERDVAVKILPEAFADDPDRLARFEREARTLAALNHPNIAAIYGLEAAGAQRALVLELVEGPTLADRLAHGAMSIDDVRPVARQIAEALEAAHDAGIVHRDLKPANIKLRPDGTVKVLDFGLAKALTDGADRSAAGVSHSPTITSPAGLTGVGMLLGTAAYMSPEQARGRNADRRSDVWAFGCVLFEMLSGTRAFPGAELTDVLAAVIKSEPDWGLLPADVSPALAIYLRRALAKDPRQRVQAVGDLRLAIDGAFDAAATTLPPQRASTARSPWLARAGWAAAGLLVGIIGMVAARPLFDSPAAPRMARFSLNTAVDMSVNANGPNGPDLAISPDGVHVVYFAGGPTTTQGAFAIRAMDRLNPTIAPGINGQAPFVSDDSRWVGFFGTDRTLKRVAIQGGAVATVCSLIGPGLGTLRGASWADNTIVFGTQTASGLWEVPASGGTPVEITKPAEGQNHVWPDILPGGAAILFTQLDAGYTGSSNEAAVAVLDRRSGTQKTLLKGARSARYVRSGHLVFESGGSLRAVAFDPDRLEIESEPVPVVEGVSVKASGAANFGVARDGTLIYIAGGTDGQRTLVFLDRAGNETPLRGMPPGNYQAVRVSPDGTRIATDFGEPRDVWSYDVARMTPTRVTAEPGDDRQPLWALDGQRLVFSAIRGGRQGIYAQAADGTGTAEMLFDRPIAGRLQPDEWAGVAQLLLADANENSQNGIGFLDLPSGRYQPPGASPLIEGAVNMSPDGRWMAYQSDRSGNMEVYVERFPERTGRQKVSLNGGYAARWSRDGKELFYVGAGGRGVKAVPVRTQPSFDPGQEVELFRGTYLVNGPGHRPFDVMPDGKRFVLIKTADGTDGFAAPEIVVVQNWVEELRRLVPPR